MKHDKRAVRPQSKAPRRWPHAILLPFTLIQLIPLVQIFLNGMRTTGEIQTFPIGLPKDLTFWMDNLRETWQKGGYAFAYASTLLIGALTVALVMVLVSVAAYALVKRDGFCKSFYTTYFVIGLSIPSFAYIVADFFILKSMNLVNSRLGIALVYTAQNIPFNLMLMRAFFMGIPRELEESAKIDGCGELGALIRITIPMAKPIITTISLLTFVSVWNEFLFSNTFLQSESVRTVAVRFYKFVSAYSADLSNVYAASTIAIFPIIVLFFCLQRTFIEGITQGGLKG